MQANPASFSTTRLRVLRVLRVDASARGEGSITRQLADLLLSELDERAPGLSVARRDLAAGLPFVDAAWVGANLAEPGVRDADQCQALALSDELVAELSAADVLVIATPIYNFGVPASLKAWVDQVARAADLPLHRARPARPADRQEGLCAGGDRRHRGGQRHRLCHPVAEVRAGLPRHHRRRGDRRRPRHAARRRRPPERCRTHRSGTRSRLAGTGRSGLKSGPSGPSCFM